MAQDAVEPFGEPRYDVINNSPNEGGRVRRFARKVTKHLRSGSDARILTRETLILGLEILKDLTPVSPPIQSAAGGILKLINCYEVPAEYTYVTRHLLTRRSLDHDAKQNG